MVELLMEVLTSGRKWLSSRHPLPWSGTICLPMLLDNLFHGAVKGEASPSLDEDFL